MPKSSVFAMRTGRLTFRKRHQKGVQPAPFEPALRSLKKQNMCSGVGAGGISQEKRRGMLRAVFVEGGKCKKNAFEKKRFEKRGNDDMKMNN